jgi:repressor LexA
MRSKNNEYFVLIEGFVDTYMDSHGISPSTREIATGTGLSTATVSRYMSYMREHGMIDYAGARNIITKRKRISSTASISVPLLGAVSCGIPKFAEGNIEEYVQLPVALFGQGEFFLLRANGDSMIDAGIDHGDLVLVKCQDHADPGQIVVALVGDEEATLKRFFPDPNNGNIRLHPENSSLDDIIVENCIIQGVACMTLKNLL